jgi:hypothetical protein
MVRVSVEVRKGAVSFDVAIRAESIRRAVSIAQGRYPEETVRVRFPIDPEGFFVEDLIAQAGIPEAEQPRKLVA